MSGFFVKLCKSFTYKTRVISNEVRERNLFEQNKRLIASKGSLTIVRDDRKGVLLIYINQYA